MNKTQGFTLLELLIVVTLIALLTLLAYPSYTTHILKTHRSQAKVNLLQLATCVEHYYAIHNSYKNVTLETCHFKPSDNSYRYEIEAEQAFFKLSAIPEGSQKQDICGILIYDQAGDKSTTNPEDSAACW